MYNKSYKTIRRLISVRWLVLLCILPATAEVAALPFLALDARGHAMGGSVVATGISNGALYNPALFGIPGDDFDWLAITPAVGEMESDPDDVELVLDRIKGGAPVTTALQGMDGAIYEKRNTRAIYAVVPSANLGGAAFFDLQEFHTAKIVGSDANAQLEHRSLDMFTIGFGFASILQGSDAFIRDLQIGVVGKLALFDSFSYSEPIAGAKLGLDQEQAAGASEFNVDVGFARERGVWKYGLVIKNLFRRSHSYGNSGERYFMEPMVRAGFAYRSRFTIFSVDFDLTENEAVGHGPASRLVALGWERRVIPGFMLRFGANQNMAEDGGSSVSGGVGFHIKGIVMDLGVSQGEDSTATVAQVGMKF